jgi:hypothetical protein
MVHMVALIDFKTYFDYEKNSEIIGRMFVACYSKISEISDIAASKNVIWIAKNTKLTRKRSAFLSIAYCYYKKIFMITTRFQKQTP